MTSFEFLCATYCGDLHLTEFWPFRVSLDDESIHDYAMRMFGARIYSGTLMPGQNLVAIWEDTLSDDSCLVATLIDDFGSTIHVYRLD